MSKETQPEKTPVLLDVVLNEVKEKGTSKVCRENGEVFIIMNSEDYCKMKEEMESLQKSVTSILDTLGFELTKKTNSNEK